MKLLMRDKNMKSSVLLATDRCLAKMPVVKGASTLVGDEHKEPFYATEVASPLFGAAVLTTDKSHSVVTSYMNKFPSGAATSVADGYDSGILYATEVAAPGGVENKQRLRLFYATEVASSE
jgi:hypothetical protein